MFTKVSMQFCNFKFNLFLKRYILNNTKNSCIGINIEKSTETDAVSENNTQIKFNQYQRENYKTNIEPKTTMI